MPAAEIERALRTIFKRCQQCPDTVPSCPRCGSGEICSLVPTSCDTCQYMTCIANPSAPPTSAGPNVGAIAGGVIGGVALMAVIMFFLWKFWIKKRREQQDMEAEEWEEDDVARAKSEHRFTHMRSDAASTRTRASFANSILSRASNIIQIAYIPGVTNRNGSSHNSLAPVPPIPAAYANSGCPKSPLSNEGDVLFFRPESTWSGTSSIRSAGNRDTQYTRQSITPSLASEMYRDNAAADPMPAIPAARAVPRMVSVVSSGATPTLGTPGSETSSGGLRVMVPGQGSSDSPSSIRGIGAFGKATQVTVGKGKGRFPIKRLSDDSTQSTVKHAPAIASPLAEYTESETEDEDEHARARRSLLRSSRSIPNSPLAQPAESPFFDASETWTPSSGAKPKPNPYTAMSSAVGSRQEERLPRAGNRQGGLSAVIEEATKRASAAPSHDGMGEKRDLSPFADRHATE